MAPMLRVSNLQTYYFSFGGVRVVKAVDDVSFTLEPGETIGLVGESGCGKTTTCLSILGLVPSAARIVDGSIEFAGEDLTRQRSARDAPHPRPADRHDSPGSDGVAEPALQHLHAGRRTGLLPSGNARPRIAAAGAGAAAGCADSLAEDAHAQISSSDERRHAPTGGGRDRHGRRAEADHRR